jgi:hypothetical protein
MSRTGLLGESRAPLAKARLGLANPILLVAGTALATWLLSGVAIGEAARFLAFELFYVLLPGCLLYVLLSPRPGGWLRVLAIGWPCGYAIEVGAFAASAALHARGLFTLLPFVAAVAGALSLVGARGRGRWDALRRGLRDRPSSSSGVEAMAVAITISAGLVLLALAYFASYPLPAHAHSVFYYPDNVWNISWAAEARHHWPITEPSVAGLRGHYYTAVFMHIAAVNQVMGVPIATVVLRLFPSMVIIVIGLQLWALGRSLGSSRWIGPAAVALLLVVEDLNLDPSRPWAFAMEVFNVIPLSPSYALGAVYFFGLLMLVQPWIDSMDAIRSPRWPPRAGLAPRGSIGPLILLFVLVLGGGVTKTSAIADFLGGLGLLWLWCLFRGRSSRVLTYGVVISVGCFFAIYLLVLRGGAAANLRVQPLTFMQVTIFGQAFIGDATVWPSLAGHSFVWLALLLCAVAITVLCGFTPILGAGWLLRRPRVTSPFTLLCVAIFGVSFAIYLTASAPGDGPGYFLIFGYIAMVPLAAKGLVELLEAVPSQQRRSLAVACAAVLILGLAVAESSRALRGSTQAAWYVWYALAYGALACVVGIAVLGLWRMLAPAAPSRAERMFACCLPLLLTLGLVQPLTQMAPRVWETILHERISRADTGSHEGITAALYGGLVWVRDHTTPCDVLAVNNHYASADRVRSVYFDYSAFTERRILLESWSFTPRGLIGGLPYPARLALNDMAVVHGSAPALRTLARDGVSYVLIDKTHGGGTPEPASVSRLVFENSALSVYRLRTPSREDRASAGCGMVSGI